MSDTLFAKKAPPVVPSSTPRAAAASSIGSSEKAAKPSLLPPHVVGPELTPQSPSSSRPASTGAYGVVGRHAGATPTASSPMPKPSHYMTNLWNERANTKTDDLNASKVFMDEPTKSVS